MCAYAAGYVSCGAECLCPRTAGRTAGAGKRTERLEPSWTDGRGFGWIDTSTRTWTPQALAQVLEKTFGMVRYSARETPIRKIAYCSGSAASMLELAAAKGCDALITGDIKHDRWYAAEFENIALFDCGHYGTERFAAEILAQRLRDAFRRHR
ncbi:MAG: Nif3-like dinuclear metal center hexameric protein [Ruminococcus sp.]